MLTAAQISRRRFCAQTGHQWPSLKVAKPGDDDFCGYCDARRTIDDQGRPHYEWDAS
jgi:hypothetical protein